MAAENLKKWLPLAVIVIVVIAAIVIIAGPKLGSPGQSLLGGMQVDPLSRATSAPVSQPDSDWSQYLIFLLIPALGAGGYGAYVYREPIGKGLHTAKDYLIMLPGLRHAIPKHPKNKVTVAEGASYERTYLSKLRGLLESTKYSTPDPRQSILENICKPERSSPGQSRPYVDLVRAERYLQDSEKLEESAKKKKDKERYLDMAKSLFMFAEGCGLYLHAWLLLIKAMGQFYGSLNLAMRDVLDPLPRHRAGHEFPQISFGGGFAIDPTKTKKTEDNLKRVADSLNSLCKQIPKVETNFRLHEPTVPCYTKYTDGFEASPRELMHTYILLDFIKLLKSAEQNYPGSAKEILSLTYLDPENDFVALYDDVFKIGDEDIEIVLGSKSFKLSDYWTNKDLKALSAHRGAQLKQLEDFINGQKKNFLLLIPYDFTLQKIFGFYFTFESLISDISDDPAGKKIEDLEKKNKPFDQYLSQINWTSSSGELPEAEQASLSATKKDALRKVKAHLSKSYDTMLTTQDHVQKNLAGGKISEDFFSSYFRGLDELLFFIQHWKAFDDAEHLDLKKYYLQRQPPTGEPFEEHYFIGSPDAGMSDAELNNEVNGFASLDEWISKFKEFAVRDSQLLKYVSFADSMPVKRFDEYHKREPVPKPAPEPPKSIPTDVPIPITPVPKPIPTPVPKPIQAKQDPAAALKKQQAEDFAALNSHFKRLKDEYIPLDLSRLESERNNLVGRVRHHILNIKMTTTMEELAEVREESEVFISKIDDLFKRVKQASGEEPGPSKPEEPTPEEPTDLSARKAKLVSELEALLKKASDEEKQIVQPLMDTLQAVNTKAANAASELDEVADKITTLKQLVGKSINI